MENSPKLQCNATRSNQWKIPPNFFQCNASIPKGRESTSYGLFQLTWNEKNKAMRSVVLSLSLVSLLFANVSLRYRFRECLSRLEFSVVKERLKQGSKRVASLNVHFSVVIKPNKKKKGNDSNNEYFNKLSVDVITSIFLRCPVKALSMLRCTSKSWNDLILSPSFARSHQKQSMKNSPKLLSMQCEYSKGVERAHQLTWKEKNKAMRSVVLSLSLLSSLFANVLHAVV
ncbi:hypothetical protein FXO38_21004 [Capsicum annuum]|uniref:F-box domain-containing protein n=1 Tax=Capsicum annuum TaxID=4072 RepID=A0A2G2Y204_CAPAN|nr:hypothetical protein FXO38_21004 [Capsicum annuum]KAF3645577.1 hypothetical protein FXO37_20902 [Capsicum annuum]PHT63777.1 hypothetical protein T459_32306 [Capsicum annuum]